MASKGGYYQLSAIPVTVFAHLLAVAITTLMLVWLLHFREGLAFASDLKQKIFNVHPLLMAIGFILVGGEAIMVYKGIPAPRKTLKLIHLVLHLVALVSGIVGIYSVFKFHNELGIRNMYSLHSWLGMSTFCLFGLQWLWGFFSFVFPGTSSRTSYAPWHVFFGVVIFIMSVLSAETGLNEKFIFLGLVRNQEALVVNFTGLLLLLFAVSVGLSVLLPA